MKILRHLMLTICVALLMTGCVRYDVGINFQDQTHGQIVQHIQLGQRLTSFGDDVLDEWLSTINQRVRQLEGTTKQLSKQELLVTIPFYNGADLEKKFNQFFNPVELKGTKVKQNKELELPQFASTFKIKQNNWLLALRNHIKLELDLRSLALVSTPENVLVGSGNLLELQFALTTPWGAKVVESAPLSEIASQPGLTTIQQEGKQVVWKLQPGEINQLEAIFWVPSWIGIGTGVIILLVSLGIYLKSLLPQRQVKKQPIPTET